MNQTLRAWLELVRLPAVFTAPADVVLGLGLAGYAGAAFEPLSGALLIGAGVLVYLAGMASNDLFDLEIDRRERPARPLPSGRLSTRQAWMFVIGAQLVSLALALVVSTQSVVVVATTIIATYVYNGLTKSSALGPVSMGLCRFLNGLIGLSVLAVESWAPWMLMFPLVVLLYVCALTFVSRFEAGQVNSTGRRASIYALAAASLLPGVLFLWSEHALQGAEWSLLILPIWLSLAVRDALRDDSEGSTRMLMIRGIHGIAVMNAVLVALLGQFILAAAIASLLIPARLVGRWFYAT